MRYQLNKVKILVTFINYNPKKDSKQLYSQEN